MITGFGLRSTSDLQREEKNGVNLVGIKVSSITYQKDIVQWYYKLKRLQIH